MRKPWIKERIKSKAPDVVQMTTAVGKERVQRLGRVQGQLDWVCDVQVEGVEVVRAEIETNLRESSAEESWVPW